MKKHPELYKNARIPFEIGAEKPNRITIDAINEAEEMEKHPELYKSYATAEEMMQDIDEKIILDAWEKSKNKRGKPVEQVWKEMGL